jgi:nucleoside-diphosphate-sugar epimerase
LPSEYFGITDSILLDHILDYIIYSGKIMQYIITGGAGFIGSHIADALSESHSVVVIDDFSKGKPENLNDIPDTVQLIKGSITDLPLLEKAFEDADGVFHLGAIASVVQSVYNPLATHETNITGTLNVLLAARDCGVRKVVFASSSAVYGNEPVLPKREEMIPVPLSPYAVSKLAGEYYCKVFSELFDIKTASLRYFNVFGPRQDPNSDYSAVIPKFISRLLDDKPPIIFGDGKQTRDFIYVKDVVRANILAMQSPATGIFNIGSGERIDLLELASVLAEIMNVNLSPVHEKVRDGDIRNSVADISHARKILGFTPQYTLKAGLVDTIESFWEKS